MTHKPILIKNVTLSFQHKICFEDFSQQVNYGSRIAIIGRNGSGKSTLLNMLRQQTQPSCGTIEMPEDIVIGYVPQIHNEYDTLSGGQRLNKALTSALSANPSLLLLDEPTNHLDEKNRKSLMRMLNSYQGTLIVVSHDTEFIRTCTDTLWHIDNGKISVFSGNYDDYMREIATQRKSTEQQLAQISRAKKATHDALMHEQHKAAQSKKRGQKSVASKKVTKMAGNLKAMKAEQSQGKKLKNIERTKQELVGQLADLRLPEELTPTFSLESSQAHNRILVQISNGCVGYASDKWVLTDIFVSLADKERMAIIGDNGSGKSTLIKALLSHPSVVRQGEWLMPRQEKIGYLDQQYNNLDPQASVLETISNVNPQWSHAETRRHLNDFLFRKNEEVNALVATLSEGEKVRLSLAQIAAKAPQLLILDEITNNLDLETKKYVAQVLKNYPGALIIICHEPDFLAEIGIDMHYNINRVGSHRSET